MIHIQNAFRGHDLRCNAGDQLVACHAHGSRQRQLGLHVLFEPIGGIFGLSPETFGSGHIHVNMSRPGRLPQRGVPGDQFGETPAGLVREIRIGGQYGQVGTPFCGLRKGHAFENPLFSGLRRNGDDKGPF